ncbi:MAG: hypothetical protein ABI042_01305 [Verrucomicrobiota bacterium]
MSASENRVATGVPPAVEPGILPGGKKVDNFKRKKISSDDPGGKMPPSTSGETPDATSSRSPVRFELATQRDDAEIRRLLRENPMPGKISISLEREPDYFTDANLPGETKQTIIARENGRVVCVGNCAIRQRFVNGESRRVGYLGGLRLDARQAGRFDILRRGYEFFRELQSENPAEFYFTSIAAENIRAQKFFERSLPGMPCYEFIDEFVTILLSARSSRRESAHFKNSERGTRNAEFDQSLLKSAATNNRYQFGPDWTSEGLTSLQSLGLRREDFCIVSEGVRIVSCASLWDQRQFKQTVIRNYAPWLAMARPTLNLFARITRRPRLPAVGETLANAFVSHLAVVSEESNSLITLIAKLRGMASERKIKFLTLGFAASDPRVATVQKQFRGREYRSRIYVVRWPEFGGAAAELDARPLAPEVALL